MQKNLVGIICKVFEMILSKVYISNWIKGKDVWNDMWCVTYRERKVRKNERLNNQLGKANYPKAPHIVCIHMEEIWRKLI